VDQLDPNELKQVSMFWRQVIKYDIAEKDILLKLVHLLLDKLENHCFFYDLLKLSKAATTKFRNLPLYENSQLVLKVIEKYALVLKQFDKLDDAWVEFNYLLCKHNSSGNFESAIESLHDIATIHHLKQEPHKALDCYQDVLSKRQEMYGDQHEKTMVTKANIASMLFETGRFREGKEILDKVIEWQLIKKNDIPRGLHSKHSLGYGYFRQKDYKNARQCFESAMETVDGITLGRVMMLTCQYNLGRTKFFLGYHQDGIEELEAVHKGQVELFGLDCIDANKTKEWIEKFVC
jgi:tetratricopeptide (TPR) repeat protein